MREKEHMPPVEPQQLHQHQHPTKRKKEPQQRRARFSSGKRSPYNKNHNHQKNSGISQSNVENQLVDTGIGGIDRDGDEDVNLEGKCGKELREILKLKSKQVRVVERGTKLEEENEGKEVEIEIEQVFMGVVDFYNSASLVKSNSIDQKQVRLARRSNFYFEGKKNQRRRNFLWPWLPLFLRQNRFFRSLVIPSSESI
ncbi:hypothetical protein PIB30_018707 [Stylosanthes scabra]|uniref:Uncharacterized protein n=1 Tax=Stylosanthes scabra TaxID=79078 RepID=A0ABU6X754_9FABA|nr:hypothetical protein [Stylosanthes scabra]